MPADEPTPRPPGTPLQQLLRAWPGYLAYVVSFLTIGGAWLLHTALTDQLARVDQLFLRLNRLGPKGSRGPGGEAAGSGRSSLNPQDPIARRRDHGRRSRAENRADHHVARIMHARVDP